jgi:hypothetical protein
MQLNRVNLEASRDRGWLDAILRKRKNGNYPWRNYHTEQDLEVHGVTPVVTDTVAVRISIV